MADNHANSENQTKKSHTDVIKERIVKLLRSRGVKSVRGNGQDSDGTSDSSVILLGNRPVSSEHVAKCLRLAWANYKKSKMKDPPVAPVKRSRRMQSLTNIITPPDSRGNSPKNGEIQADADENDDPAAKSNNNDTNELSNRQDDFPLRSDTMTPPTDLGAQGLNYTRKSGGAVSSHGEKAHVIQLDDENTPSRVTKNKSKSSTIGKNASSTNHVEIIDLISDDEDENVCVDEEEDEIVQMQRHLADLKADMPDFELGEDEVSNQGAEDDEIPADAEYVLSMLLSPEFEVVDQDSSSDEESQEGNLINENMASVAACAVMTDNGTNVPVTDTGSSGENITATEDAERVNSSDSRKRGASETLEASEPKKKPRGQRKDSNICDNKENHSQSENLDKELPILPLTSNPPNLESNAHVSDPRDENKRSVDEAPMPLIADSSDSGMGASAPMDIQLQSTPEAAKDGLSNKEMDAELSKENKCQSARNSLSRNPECSTSCTSRSSNEVKESEPLPSSNSARQNDKGTSEHVSNIVTETDQCQQNISRNDDDGASSDIEFELAVEHPMRPRLTKLEVLKEENETLYNLFLKSMQAVDPPDDFLSGNIGIDGVIRDNLDEIPIPNVESNVELNVSENNYPVLSIPESGDGLSSVLIDSVINPAVTGSSSKSHNECASTSTAASNNQTLAVPDNVSHEGSQSVVGTEETGSTNEDQQALSSSSQTSHAPAEGNGQRSETNSVDDEDDSNLPVVTIRKDIFEEDSDQETNQSDTDANQSSSGTTQLASQTTTSDMTASSNSQVSFNQIVETAITNFVRNVPELPPVTSASQVNVAEIGQSPLLRSMITTQSESSSTVSGVALSLAPNQNGRYEPITTPVTPIPDAAKGSDVANPSSEPNNSAARQEDALREVVRVMRKNYQSMDSEFARLENIFEVTPGTNWDLPEAASVMNTLKSASYKLYELLDCGVNALRARNGGPFSNEEQTRLQDIQLTVEEMTNYCAVLADGVLLNQRNNINPRIRSVLMMIILRLLKLLNYFMVSSNPAMSERKFQNVCSMIVNNPVFNDVTPLQATRVMVQLWEAIRSYGMNPNAHRDGAILDHNQIGSARFQERISRLKQSVDRQQEQERIAAAASRTNDVAPSVPPPPPQYTGNVESVTSMPNQVAQNTSSLHANGVSQAQSLQNQLNQPFVQQPPLYQPRQTVSGASHRHNLNQAPPHVNFIQEQVRNFDVLAAQRQRSRALAQTNTRFTNVSNISSDQSQSQQLYSLLRPEATSQTATTDDDVVLLDERPSASRQLQRQQQQQPIQRPQQVQIQRLQQHLLHQPHLNHHQQQQQLGQSNVETPMISYSYGGVQLGQTQYYGNTNIANSTGGGAITTSGANGLHASATSTNHSTDITLQTLLAQAPTGNYNASSQASNNSASTHNTQNTQSHLTIARVPQPSVSSGVFRRNKKQTTQTHNMHGSAAYNNGMAPPETSQQIMQRMSNAQAPSGSSIQRSQLPNILQMQPRGSIPITYPRKRTAAPAAQSNSRRSAAVAHDGVLYHQVSGQNQGNNTNALSNPNSVSYQSARFRTLARSATRPAAPATWTSTGTGFPNDTSTSYANQYQPAGNTHTNQQATMTQEQFQRAQAQANTIYFPNPDGSSLIAAHSASTTTANEFHEWLSQNQSQGQ